MEDAGDRDKAFVVLPCSLHPASTILHVFGLGGELDFLFQKSLIVQGANFASVVCQTGCEFDVVHNRLNIGIEGVVDHPSAAHNSPCGF
jgi:hypothetical protein